MSEARDVVNVDATLALHCFYRHNGRAETRSRLSEFEAAAPDALVSYHRSQHLHPMRDDHAHNDFHARRFGLPSFAIGEGVA